MNKTQPASRWVVNVFCFVLVLVLVLTGLINWALPGGGHQAAGTVLVLVRHFLKQVHQLAALLFMVALMVHLWQHWAYIRTRLRPTGKNP